MSPLVEVLILRASGYTRRDSFGAGSRPNVSQRRHSAEQGDTQLLSHQPLFRWLVTSAVWIAGLMALTVVAFGVLRRVARHSPASEVLNRRCRRPAIVATALLGLSGGLDGNSAPPRVAHALGHIVTLALIASIAWLLIEISFVAEDAAMRRFDLGISDNLRARAKRTQIAVLRRVTVVIIGLLAGAVMLTTFHQARVLGTSLLASAGIAGLAAGAAARPTLGNLVAGVQLALSEPVRLDDVVVVEGEWGKIEEITLTYVVVRIWDSRRLVLPVSYFVENPFQNWTRSTADLLGTAFFHLDYRVPLDEMRREFERIVAASPAWDGRVAVLQVTDTTEHTIEVRALMSAPNSSAAFDLRCHVRERLVSWLQANHPDSLPRTRIETPIDRFAGSVRQ